MCDRKTHAATKADPLAWSALRFVGVQAGESDPGDPSAPVYDLELRDCTCGSTLARPIVLNCV